MLGQVTHAGGPAAQRSALERSQPAASNRQAQEMPMTPAPTIVTTAMEITSNERKSSWWGPDGTAGSLPKRRDAIRKR